MSTLVDTLALRPADVAGAQYIGLWVIAIVAVSVVRPPVFLRGLDPELIPDRTRAFAWFYQRLYAAMVLGCAAWLGVSLSDGGPSDFGFAWGRIDRALGLIAGIILVASPAFMALQGREALAKTYPEIRIRRWTGRLLSNNRTTWVAYLSAYEGLLRGVCLFGIAAWSSPLLAVLLTSALDISAHARRPPGEVAARVPLALALGVGTLWSGSVLGACVAQSLLMLTAETLGRSASAGLSPRERRS